MIVAMMHDAKPGARARCNKALRQLADAQRREAVAADHFAEHTDAAASASGDRAVALREASRATGALATSIADADEAARTERQSVLLAQQSRQASAEQSSGRMRARASRAQAARARAQAECNESFVVAPIVAALAVRVARRR
jgi:hypothetical protein